MFKRIYMGYGVAIAACLHIVCFDFDLPPAVAQDTPPPVLQNGDFEDGLRGWTQDFSSVRWPEGNFTASGLAQVSADPRDNGGFGDGDQGDIPREDHFLQMMVAAHATSTSGPAIAGGSAELVVTQGFTHMDSGMIKTQAALAFSVTATTDTRARLEFSLDMIDSGTGDTQGSAPIAKLEFNGPCVDSQDNGGAINIIGFLPWDEYRFMFPAPVPGQPTAMEARIRVTVNVESQRADGNISIATQAMVDDVQVLFGNFKEPPTKDRVGRRVTALLRGVPDGSVPPGGPGDVGLIDPINILQDAERLAAGDGETGDDGNEDSPGDFRLIKLPTPGGPVGDCQPPVKDVTGVPSS